MIGEKNIYISKEGQQSLRSVILSRLNKVFMGEKKETEEIHNASQR